MRSYRLAFWVLTLIGLTIDQGSKYLIGAFHIVAKFTDVTDSGEDFLSRLRTVGGKQVPHVNHGALFGIGPEHNIVFAIISIGAALGIGICSTRRSVAADRLLCVALGLILAGTLGNLYDRIVFHGVRDFLWWHGGFNWPVFNIADCCLVCGAATLLIQAFFLPEPLPHAAAVQQAQAVTTE
jgi:lipoprotein signal peptidase